MEVYVTFIGGRDEHKTGRYYVYSHVLTPFSAHHPQCTSLIVGINIVRSHVLTPFSAHQGLVHTSSTCLMIASEVPKRSVAPGFLTCSSRPPAPGATVFLRSPSWEETSHYQLLSCHLPGKYRIYTYLFS